MSASWPVLLGSTPQFNRVFP